MERFWYAGMGFARAGPRREGGAVYRPAGECEFQPCSRPAFIRHSEDPWPVYSKGSVLYDATLRPPRNRRGVLPAQGDGTGGKAQVALAGRVEEDRQYRTHSRFRMLGQSASHARPLEQWSMDRRSAES